MGGGGAGSVVSRRPSDGGQSEPSVLIGRRGFAKAFGCCGRMGVGACPPLSLSVVIRLYMLLSDG